MKVGSNKMVLAAETIRNGGGPGNKQSSKDPIQMVDDSSDEEKIYDKKNNGTNMKSVKNKTGEYEAEKIRVGRDYQVVCPEIIPEKDRNIEALSEKALLVWSPTKDIPESKLEDYITVAKEKYGYNGEQALGMLFWHKHDLERAVMDLANFTPFPDEWTVEDKVLFEQAFQFHGKSFNRIRQMLPDKSIASLVKYYYSWKKTRARPIDRPERNKHKHDGVVGAGSENGSDPGSNEVSDMDEKHAVETDTPKSSPPPDSTNATITITTSSTGGSSSNTTETNSNSRTSSSNNKPEVEIVNKRTSPAVTPGANLDEITIVPISRNSTSSDTNAPPTKTMKLNDQTSVATAGGP